MLALTIRTDNAAFEGGRPGDECARLLHLVADRLVIGETRGRLLDVNGNHVGEWALTEGDEAPARARKAAPVCVKCGEPVTVPRGSLAHTGHVEPERNRTCGWWGFRLRQSGAGAGGGQ